MDELAEATLDRKISSLVPEVDGVLRSGLEASVRTLRDAGNPESVWGDMSRLGLQLMEKILASAGQLCPSDNLNDCIARAFRGKKDKDSNKAIKGLYLLPEEMASHLHTVRILSNKIHHNAEKVKIGVDDAENALRLYLRVLSWFYCESERGPRLPTIYSSESNPATTVAEMIRTFLESQTASTDRERELQLELARLRIETVDSRHRTEMGGERVVGPVPGAAVQHFCDRVSELRRLHKFLGEENTCVLLVCGRGGMGKTTLVTKLVHDLRTQFSNSPDSTPGEVDGVVYVSLRTFEFRSVSRLVDLICRSLGTNVAADLQAKWSDKSPLAERLEFLFLHSLASRRLLIVLDNFEDVLDERNRISDEFAELRQFIETCLELDHNAKIIATSRRTLVLSEELAGRIGGRLIELPLDPGLPDGEAAGLLRDLDSGGILGIQQSPDDLLLKVAQRCHGIPRTIETLVGTLRQRRTMSLQQLLERDNGDAFTRIAENPARELNETLALDERLVTQCLAVYDRPISNTAVGYLLPGLPVDEIMDRLVRNYVVAYDAGRFSIHPLDRQYAYSQIPDEGTVYSKPILHLGAARLFRELRKSDTEWNTVDDLEPQIQEFHHLVCAHAHDEAFRLLDALEPLVSGWGYSALMAELRLKLTGHLGDSQLEENNWGRLGKALFDAGEVEKAVRCFERAVLTARERDDRQARLEWLDRLANALLELGETEKAGEICEHALTLAREVGNRGQEGVFLGNLGAICRDRGETEKAIAYHEQAVEMAREVNNARDEGIALGDLGHDYVDLRDMHNAIRYYEMAVVVFHGSGERRKEGHALGDLGCAVGELGEFKAAIPHLEKALAIARELGNRWDEANVLDDLGEVFSDLGQLEESIQYYTQALSIAHEIGNRGTEETILRDLGWAYADLGQLPQAAEHFKKALEIAREVGNSNGQIKDLGDLGDLYADFGGLEKAISYYQDALFIARSIGDKVSMSDLLEELARAHHLLSEFADARRFYEESLTASADAVSCYSCSIQLGILDLQEGRPEESRSQIEQGIAGCRSLLAKTPGDDDLLRWIALAQLASGQPEDALGTYRQALEVRSLRGLVQRMLQDVEVLSRATPNASGLEEVSALLAPYLETHQ